MVQQYTKEMQLLSKRLMPFPGLSSSGDQVLGKWTVPGQLCILITSLVPNAQFPGCVTRAPVLGVLCLLWVADLRL